MELRRYAGITSAWYLFVVVDSFELLFFLRYPNATAEELASGDNVCIICREEMTTSCKKLPCNHIFHTSCLRSWFQRQQTCPTCRLDVLRMPRPTQTPVAEAANANAPVNNGLQQQQQQQQFFQNRELIHFWLKKLKMSVFVVISVRQTSEPVVHMWQKL